MSEPQHHYPIKLAVGIAVGTVALIVGIILIAQFAIGAYGGRSMKDEPSMAPKEVAKRIAPVAKLAIDPNAPATPPAAAVAPVAKAAVSVPPPAAKSGGAAAGGKAVYDSTCGVCHATGVAGAPKLGDKAAWASRMKGGKDALYASVTKGKGAMPPKGGNAALADADLKAAVDYLTAGAK